MISRFLTFCLVLSLVCNIYFIMMLFKHEDVIKNKAVVIHNKSTKKELPYVIDDGKGGLRRLTTDDFIR